MSGKDNRAMPTSHDTRHDTRQRRRDTDLLIKGVLCTLIGLAIVLAPRFIGSGDGLGAVVAQSSLVGWFALVLGLAFVANYALRRARR